LPGNKKLLKRQKTSQEAGKSGCGHDFLASSRQAGESRPLVLERDERQVAFE
jgi:hypothetical protein